MVDEEHARPRDADDTAPRAVIGRDDELAELDARLASVVANGAAALVLGGEPGIGKTSLVRAFAARCEGRARVAVARCSPYDFDALQPVRKLLVALGAPAPDALERAGPVDPVADADQARHRQAQVFGDATDGILDAVGSEPTVLALDDVHWGQPLLHGFLAHLTEALLERRRRHRLLLVLVTRVLPPPHPVALLLGDLERHAGVDQVELDALAGSTIAALVERSTDRRPSSAFVDLVERSARGNPLRALAALQVLRSRGVDVGVRSSDQRTWGAVRLPPELSDPVTAWIRALPEATRAVMSAAAVWGDEFTLAELGAIAPGGPGDLHDHVRAALEAELLGTDGHLHWFGHAAFREVVTQLADLAELRRCHARCAALLRGDEATDATLMRVGHHLLAADEEAAPEDRFSGLHEAGRAALRAASWTEAARYLEVARSVAPSASASPARLADVHLALGHAYYFDHDFEVASAALEDAIEVAAACDDHRAWGQALVTWLRIRMVTRTDSLQRVPPADAAHRFLAASRDPALRSMVLQVLAELNLTAGDTTAGADLAEQAVREAEDCDDHTVRAFALYARAFADNVAMRAGAGLDGVRAAFTEACQADDWFVRDIMQARLPFALLAAGEVDEADREASTAIAQAARRQEHSNQALGYCVRAAVALLRGDFDDFDVLADQARREAERSAYVLADVFTGPTVALAHVYRGDLDAAAEAAATWPNLPRSAREALSALAGASTGALDLRPPRVVTQVSAGFYAALLEAALHRSVLDGLEEAAALLEAWTAEGFEYPPSLPVSLTRLRAEIALALGDLATADRLFRHAVTTATASGAQVELARSLAGAARLGRQAGGGDLDAEQLAARAASIARLVGLDPELSRLDEPTRTNEPAAEHPTVAVLVSDVVGSTAVSRQLGDVAYYELVMAHHELVRSCLRRWSGHEFSESGDGLLAWFDSAPRAVRAALDIHRRAQGTAVLRSGLRLKLSLACGPTLMRAGRPYGLVLNRASRLLETAKPNEIVLDSTVTAALPQELRVASSRPIELRGIGWETVSVLAS